ncbi:peptidoglycan-recognition protein LA isoform X3 [Drosophila subpulchrella]|nr:peptidoglycan-recognition protein LA isoform X3 [Drosophila subpulchrella]
MFEENGNPSRDNALWTLQGRERPSPAQRLHNLTSASSTSSSSGLPIPQNIFTNPAIQPSSVINLNHSTDVVIGPMTQYQGPVSIYYMDYMEAHAMQTAAGINSNHANGNANRSRDKSPSKRLTRNTILLITLIFLVLATGLVVLYVELNRPRPELPSNKAIYFGNNYDHDT